MPRAFAAVLSLSAAPVFSSLTDVSLLLRVSFGATRMVPFDTTRLQGLTVKKAGARSSGTW